MKLIDKDAVLAEIENRIRACGNCYILDELASLHRTFDTLEVKEVDLKKLGEIARHLIAVKENIEDMRLDSSEWNLLKRIGYPERFKAQKGD